MNNYQIEDTILTAQMIRQIIIEGRPVSHNENLENLDLGFGWLYYGLTKVIKPDLAVCIGSRRGFVPLLIGLAMKSNKKGKVFLIDPGYDKRLEGERAMSGEGFWRNSSEVQQLLQSFGLTGVIDVRVMTSGEAYATCPDLVDIDLLFIDGDHTEAGVRFDFESFGSRLRPGGFILFHDCFYPFLGVYRVVQELFNNPLWEVILFPFEPGLAFARLRNPNEEKIKQKLLSEYSTNLFDVKK